MNTKTFQQWLDSSHLSAGNAAYIEELYEIYLQDPQQVPAEWRSFFKSLPQVNGELSDNSHAAIREYFARLVKQPRQTIAVNKDSILEQKQANVERLIEAYRCFGHLAANIDPLGSSRPAVPELELSYHNLSQSDFATQFVAPQLMGKATASLQEIVSKLRATYCGSIGFEYKYIRNQTELKWLQQRIEGPRPNYSDAEKKQILEQLVAADGLEKYLGHKYVGQKRFSLEGGDSLIPLLKKMVQAASQLQVKNVVMAMAHRGRLNVLLNVVGQSPEELFQAFAGTKDYGMTSGDVKYHLGFAADVQTANGSVHLSLAFNPSHLEIVSPVALGIVRARQDRRDDQKRDQVLPIIMHGDASFAGQGVVMETFNMSQTRAYYVGGAVHIVINNQVGFTTDPEDSRSSIYCTDAAKIIDAPVFHVNGDDPEAVVFLAQLAIDYRMTFHKDIVIDLVCFRRLGHNEADEPAATQPLMYQKIRAHAATYELYAQQLTAAKIIEPTQMEAMVNNYRNTLDQGQQIVPLVSNVASTERAANWSRFMGQDANVLVNTSISPELLQKVTTALGKLPADFELQRQVGHVIAARQKMFEGEQPLNWGAAETLAYASLLAEGYPIRICGQDSCRGTFAHRHAELHDQKSEKLYIPLEHLSADQAKIHIYDSTLSEEAALAFEYGYAQTDPQTLVIWEAQYGDFANGAQVVVDQFISSGEQKWQRLSGVVMMLPHGYEGAGPEHSSARLERYLQLCAQHNMQVVVPTTPAQIFHLLRRQMLRPYRKPLIIMSPKNLLRHKMVFSSLSDLTQGKFHLVIAEMEKLPAESVRRVVLCSGKVYYDLLAKREEKQQNDVALVRIEQLYPFPYDEVKAELEKYPNAKEVVWCQEEPQNQGAWFIIQDRILSCLTPSQNLRYVGREPSAAPAAGYAALHNKQQAELVEKSLA